VSFDAERRAEVGRRLAVALRRSMQTPCHTTCPVTLRVAGDLCAALEIRGGWYWIAFDPLGVGNFGLFAPTSYCGGLLLGNLITSLGKMPLLGEW